MTHSLPSAASPLAVELFAIGAIKFSAGEGFALAVHEKHPQAPRSPFYIDLRRLRSFPRFIRAVADFMAADGDQLGLWERADLLSDVPTAATPLVTLISQKTGIPMISPRLAAKGHGTDEWVIGVWERGQRVVVIDDLRTTGGSKEEVIRLYDAAGLATVAIYALIDRGNPERAPIAELPFYAPLLWSSLLTFYRAEQLIGETALEECQRYPERLSSHLTDCPGCI